ncbi:hypothetical protein V6N13_148592 [Hibiscus sabdariffa]
MGFLVETKAEVVLEVLIRSIWWTDSFRYVFSPSVGLSRAIVVVWETSKFVVSNVCCDSRFVLVIAVWIAENWRCGMMAVYAPCLLANQLVFWQSLVTLLGSLDLLLLGASLHGMGVDIRLMSGTVDWGLRPFRFLNCWLEKPSHVQLMGKERDRISSMAKSSISIMDKLQSLKPFLKIWNRESFVSVDLQIEVSTELINYLDERRGLAMNPRELVEMRRPFQGNLWRLLKYRSSIWRQKSRVQWVREGIITKGFFNNQQRFGVCVIIFGVYGLMGGG